MSFFAAATESEATTGASATSGNFVGRLPAADVQPGWTVREPAARQPMGGVSRARAELP